MSDDARIIALTAEAEGLRRELDLVRAENAALRPRVSELEAENQRLKRHAEYIPDPAKAETEAIVNPAREHA